MTVVNTGKCIFCGAQLDEHHQCICADCVARYKQEHTQEFAEARLRYHLSRLDTDRCLVCGQEIPLLRGCLCPWCMGAIADEEARRRA